MTDKQTREYNLYLSIDPNLTESDFLGMEYYASVYRGTDSELRQNLSAGKAFLHRKNNLISSNRVERTIGNCLRSGKEEWTRRDNAEFTQVDIDALKALSYGQECWTSAKAGSVTATVVWTVDSSD